MLRYYHCCTIEPEGLISAWDQLTYDIQKIRGISMPGKSPQSVGKWKHSSKMVSDRLFVVGLKPSETSHIGFPVLYIIF